MWFLLQEEENQYPGKHTKNSAKGLSINLDYVTLNVKKQYLKHAGLVMTIIQRHRRQVIMLGIKQLTCKSNKNCATKHFLNFSRALFWLFLNISLSLQ